MTNAEALAKALAATRTAVLENDLGDLTAGEVVGVVEDYLRVAFGKLTLKEARHFCGGETAEQRGEECTDAERKMRRLDYAHGK